MTNIQIFALFLFSMILAYLVAGVSQLLITGKFHVLVSLRTKILMFLSATVYVVASLTILPAYPIYFIFISALLITIHSDINHQLISRFTSLYLIPVGLLASCLNMLPTFWVENLTTCIAAAALLFTINKIFYFFKRHDGLGQGDIELLACIGAWIGAIGTWFVIIASSTLGTAVGCMWMLYSGKKIQLLPFGPFLAVSALLYIFFSHHILTWSGQLFS